MTWSTQRRAGGEDHPSSLPASEPAPGAGPPLVAEGGKPVISPDSRDVPGARRGSGVRDDPSRMLVRGGAAGAGTRSPAPASTSASPSPPADGADRGAAESPPAPSRNAPAAGNWHGGRGTQNSPLPARGSGAGRGAQSSPSERGGPGGGSEPGGGGRTHAAPPSPGTTQPLGGQAFRDAWKTAESAKNAAGRRRRARRPSSAALPGIGGMRLASRPPASFDDAPPPPLRIKPQPEPPEAA
jgi:hypothetical protein